MEKKYSKRNMISARGLLTHLVNCMKCMEICAWWMQGNLDLRF